MKLKRFVVESKNQRLKIAALLLTPMLALLLIDRFVSPHYRLALNESSSLPGTLYLVRAGKQPACGPEQGDFVQFQMTPESRWYTEERMLKVAKGCPGDVITVVDRQVFINDWLAGEAVPALEDGTAMEVIPPGVVPDGHYYMWASHPASFDSRYAEFSLIAADQVIGAATRIF